MTTLSDHYEWPNLIVARNEAAAETIRARIERERRARSAAALAELAPLLAAAKPATDAGETAAP